MVIIEAMAKARPVIAPRLTAIPEMVAEGQTGYLFRQGDAEDLAHQLSRFTALTRRPCPLGSGRAPVGAGTF